MAFGYMLTAIYLLWSLKYGPIASANSWRAYGLEWQTASPPPTGNFYQTPIVTREVYDYEFLDRTAAHVSANASNLHIVTPSSTQ